MNLISEFRNRFKNDIDFNELLTGGGISFIIQSAGLLAGYLFIYYLSYLYGDDTPAIYGEYILITLILRYGGLLAGLGIKTAMLRFVAKLAKQMHFDEILRINKLAWKIIGVSSAVICLILIFIAPHLALLLDIPTNLLLLAILFIIFQVSGNYYSQCLRGLKKIASASFLANAAIPILNISLLIIAAFFITKDFVYYGSLPVMTYFIAIVVNAIMGLFLWRKEINAKLRFRRVDRANIFEDQSLNYKALLNVGLPLILAESIVFINTWTSQLMLGGLGSTADVGIFSVCFKFMLLITLVLSAFNSISAPKFSEMFSSGEYEKLRKSVITSTKLISLMSLPIFIVIVMFPKFFLGLFGDGFERGSVALIILSSAKLFSAFCGSTGTLLQMTGNQKVIQNAVLLSLILGITVNYFLIPNYGILGAAIASASGIVVVNLIMLVSVRRLFGFWSIYTFKLRST